MPNAQTIAPEEHHFLNKAYWDGKFVSLSGEARTALHDPSTGEICGTLVHATSTDVTRAILAARAAFDGGWGTAPKGDRLSALSTLRHAIQSHREAFARIISQEIGTPIDFAREGQVDAAIGHLDSTIHALADTLDDHPLRDTADHRVRHEPLGVAALITPWNWPLNQVVLKLAGALAAGCTVVLKPSELSTRTALLLAQIVDALNLPDGVFNMVIGGADTGEALASHPEIDIVSFTGSTHAGKSVARAAAGNLTRTALELGGKSANILFADCHLETAITQGVAHCFRNAGQSCNAASRMLVQESIYDEALALITAAVEQTRVARPDEVGRRLIGPQASAAQFARVQSYITLGQDEGLRLLSGGTGRPVGFKTGYCTRPTAFADVPQTSRLFSEEIFGPVLTVTPFKSEEDAIKLANATPYALAGYIQTRNLARADRVAKALSCGMVQINGTSRASGAPFGGRKASGFGRESGLWGIRAFQDIKSISGAPDCARL